VREAQTALLVFAVGVKSLIVTAWKPPTVVVIISVELSPVPFVLPVPVIVFVPVTVLLEPVPEPLVELLPLVLPELLVEPFAGMSLWIQS
jgi:hypothetical protein